MYKYSCLLSYSNSFYRELAPNGSISKGDRQPQEVICPKYRNKLAWTVSQVSFRLTFCVSGSFRHILCATIEGIKSRWSVGKGSGSHCCRGWSQHGDRGHSSWRRSWSVHSGRPVNKCLFTVTKSRAYSKDMTTWKYSNLEFYWQFGSKKCL